ncbi:hypothetical protein GCM10010284_66110 [Streptomyces rubiginosohelvolus]|nr:hypothetical protein GCM10010284_66110 [Streptomyces rubiginosohelvolus]
MRTKFLITTAFYRPHPTPVEPVALVLTRPGEEVHRRNAPPHAAAARGLVPVTRAATGTRGPSRTPGDPDLSRTPIRHGLPTTLSSAAGPRVCEPGAVCPPGNAICAGPNCHRQDTTDEKRTHLY